jgi:hypothetical protein
LVRAVEVKERWERELGAARKGEMLDEREVRSVGAAEVGTYEVGMRGDLVFGLGGR